MTTPLQRLENLLWSDDCFQVSFSTSILPGRMRSASLITRGKGEWVMGYGNDVESALDDLLRQVEGRQDGPTRPKKPAPEKTRPLLPGMTRPLLPGMTR